MPFESVFEEVSDTLIFDNLISYVEDNMLGALVEKFPTESLPDFAQRTLGRYFKLGSYPVFAVDPDRNGPQQSADGSWVEDAVRIQCFLAVSNADGPTATRLALKYATAFKAVLRKAERVQAFTANFPVNSVFACTMEFSYEYGLIGKNADGYEKPINFEILLKFNER